MIVKAALLVIVATAASATRATAAYVVFVASFASIEQATVDFISLDFDIAGMDFGFKNVKGIMTIGQNFYIFYFDGPWEQIFYGEFDGKRKKRVLVKIIGEQSI